MPQPTSGDVHVNTPLTNFSVAYIQDANAFVADKVFPNLPVQKQSDRYYVFTRGDWNRNTMRKRAPGAESAGQGYTLDNTPSYFADIWGLHHDIPDPVRANSDSVLAPDMDATQFLTQQALISREIQFANTFFTTSVWTTQYTGTAASGSVDSTHVLQWNDPKSTPIEDIRVAKGAVQLTGGGYRPNKLTLGRQVFDKLVDHPDFVDRIKAGQTPGGPAIMQKQAMAQILELDEVLVMDSVYNTAAEGATESNSYIGGKSALLTYSPASVGLQIPTAGITFSWNGFFGAGIMGNRIKSFRMEWLESDRIEIEMAYALAKVSADLGAFWTTVIA